MPKDGKNALRKVEVPYEGRLFIVEYILWRGIKLQCRAIYTAVDRQRVDPITQQDLWAGILSCLRQQLHVETGVNVIY